ncbi:MAG TPA: FAD-dependent thymidylate synthase [Anaerolineae bacterium]|nr:FAD-dependent thymidylate synthase [Anaerolineae bacterium]
MRVCLLAYTQLNPDVDALPEPLRHPSGTAQERLVEFAGRVCYRSTDRMGHGGRFVQARVREGHESIVEHVSFTFLVEGISRSCSHQLVRHRLASYSQESQRYCDLGPDDQLVMPPAISQDREAQAIWEQAVAGLQKTYEALRQRGIRKEDARFLLPNAAATRIVVTMNGRSLRHFLSVRLPRSAQWEIRAVARVMLRLAYPLAPTMLGDLHSRDLAEPDAAEGK